MAPHCWHGGVSWQAVRKPLRSMIPRYKSFRNAPPRGGKLRVHSAFSPIVALSRTRPGLL